MWTELAEYGRRAPSPHNTQPTRLHAVDDRHAELWFEPSRGLRVGDPEGRFTYLTFGIFAETLRIAAHARCCELDVTYTGGPLYGDHDAPRKVADIRLAPQADVIEDLDPALILRRRTNRLPYDGRPVAPEVLAALRAEAAGFGQTFDTSTDSDAIRWVKELNRDSLYHDLEHAQYRRELETWLRYSDDEATRRADGLSARALAMPGWLLRGVMRHHRMLTAPGIKQVTQRVYMSTMTGISTVGWLQGNFANLTDWARAGHLMARMWLILTSHGVDWQPYGSVITNEAARRSMVKKFGIVEGADGQNMTWLLVRMGYPIKEPVRSERLALAEVMV